MKSSHHFQAETIKSVLRTQDSNFPNHLKQGMDIDQAVSILGMGQLDTPDNSHWGPPSSNAPYSYETRVFKFPRICGSSGEQVVHNIYKFSINRPVLSCLFRSSFKRTQDMRLWPHPPPRSDGSLLCLSCCCFPPPGLPLPITYLNLGRFGVGLQVRIYYKTG